MSFSFTRIHSWLAQITGLSALVAAAGFHLTLAWAGPDLATGLLFYAAETDAVPRPLPYPSHAVGLVLGTGATMLLAGIALRKARFGWLALVLALVALGQGVNHFLNLMEAARP